jgi:biopolymer transport protein ExbD
MSTATNNEDGDPGFQIAPMVDIVFVLLLFFMTYKSVKELYVEATPSGHKPSNTLVSVPTKIEIMADDSVTVNGTTLAAADDIQFSKLSSWLDSIRSTTTKEEPFVIHATDQTRHERVVRVLSILNKAGFKKVSFS